MQNQNIKLTYRGVSYDYELPTLDMVESSVGGRYRGYPWRLRYPRHIPASEPIYSLQYRGVHYYSERPTEIRARVAERVTSTPKPCQGLLTEVDQIHRNNIWKNLERRLQVAKAKGDKVLLEMLENESKQLRCLV